MASVGPGKATIRGRSCPPAPALPSWNPFTQLRLVVDWRRQKVLFGVAGKDMVDHLFGILAIRMSSLVRLLAPEEGEGGDLEGGCPLPEHIGVRMARSLAHLQVSAEALNRLYLREPFRFDRHIISPSSSSYPRLLRRSRGSLPPRPGPPIKDVSVCAVCELATVFPGRMCPRCSVRMTPCYSFIDGHMWGNVMDHGDGGYVQDAVYMITDDLKVSPDSSSSSLALLRESGLRIDEDLEEMLVHVGKEQALALVKASLESTTVLTDVFLEKKYTKYPVQGKGREEKTVNPRKRKLVKPSLEEKESSVDKKKARVEPGSDSSDD